MKVGTVIVNENKSYVITQIIDGVIVDRVPLELFIAQNVVIPYKGEYRTIKEIIQEHCDDYLSKNEIINE